MRRLAILVGSKGRGTNMASILSACRTGAIPARAAVVVSPKEGTPAVDRALAHGVPVAVLSPRSPGYAEELIELLHQEKVDLVCLAGYMTLLPEAIVDAYEGRILNIHPALLPRHGGKGMYGEHVHKAVLAAGDQESGCTVHYVTKEYDEGPPLLQSSCPVMPDDTWETLAERVLGLEAAAYPQAISLALAKLPEGGQES